MLPTPLLPTHPRFQLFFAKVAPSATADDVRRLFAPFGDVESINLFRAWATARSSKGCGLITMATPDGAHAARDALNDVHVWEGADAPMAIEWCCPSKLGAKAATTAANKAAAAAERAAAAAERSAGRRRGARASASFHGFSGAGGSFGATNESPSSITAPTAAGAGASGMSHSVSSSSPSCLPDPSAAGGELYGGGANSGSGSGAPQPPIVAAQKSVRGLAAARQLPPWLQAAVSAASNALSSAAPQRLVPASAPAAVAAPQGSEPAAAAGTLRVSAPMAAGAGAVVGSGSASRLPFLLATRDAPEGADASVGALLTDPQQQASGAAQGQAALLQSAPGGASSNALNNGALGGLHYSPLSSLIGSGGPTSQGLVAAGATGPYGSDGSFPGGAIRISHGGDGSFPAGAIRLINGAYATLGAPIQLGGVRLASGGLGGGQGGPGPGLVQQVLQPGADTQAQPSQLMAAPWGVSAVTLVAAGEGVAQGVGMEGDVLGGLRGARGSPLGAEIGLQPALPSQVGA